MTVERKQIPAVLAAMIGLVMSDPETLLFDYALAASKGDEDSLEIAKFYKKQAEALGVTDGQFQKALEVMKTTNQVLDKISKTE